MIPIWLAELGLKAATNAKRDVDAVGGWLGQRKPSELLAMGLALALVVQHVINHRYMAKLEKQISSCSSALTSTRSAFDQTVANYRAAAAKAKADDAANKARVETQQRAINERTDNEYQARLAAARALADSLQHKLAAAAHPGGSATAPVSGVPAASGGSHEAAGKDGFSIADKLTATEQAIQLDELIKWIRAQHAVDVNGGNDAK